MTEEKLEKSLERTLAVIDTLPASQREGLRAMVEETRKRHRDIQTSTRQSLDALDDWRLLQKYAQFDLEAKMREVANRQRPSEGEPNL